MNETEKVTHTQISTTYKNTFQSSYIHHTDTSSEQHYEMQSTAT